MPGIRPFQERVDDWVLTTFTPTIRNDITERCDRLTEEACELTQSLGYSRERAHALVDYVFDRDVGEPIQELGGTMLCVHALANAAGLNVDAAAEKELARCWTKVDVIRAKQKAKPTRSALPQ